MINKNVLSSLPQLKIPSTILPSLTATLGGEEGVARKGRERDFVFK